MAKLIHHLRQRLEQPLPGIEAQMQMISHKLAMPASKISRFHVPENHRKASVLALLYKKEGIWHTALMQRPESPYPHSKQVSFPGGGYEETDLDDAFTALRETEEEFGIPKDNIELIGKLTHVYIPVSNYLVHPFVGYLQEAPLFIPDETEVAEIVEVPIDQLLDPANRRMKTIETHGGMILPDVPYFALNNKTVWGATAMMLSEFAAVLGDLGILQVHK
jgi:8-oxo-dGTP pyrophosphatase MutT (NUDIX family)